MGLPINRKGGGVVELILIQLGDKSEYNKCELLDFTLMGKEAEDIVVSIHQLAMTEFMSRDIFQVWDWEIRTKHVFKNNYIQQVRDVLVLTKSQVKQLVGCGRITQKEVYDIFKMFNIQLDNWRSPNYKFKE